MLNNISPGADGQANHTLTVLRKSSKKGKLATDMKFLPGLKLNADPALALSGTYRSPAGRMLDFDAQVGPNPGHWVGLHLALPARDVSQNGVLGFAARIFAPDVTVIRACLRSGTKEGFVDCFFDKHLLLRAEEATHLDALPLQYRDEIPQKAPWRELVFFLPTQDFRFSLIDLRVFLV